MNKEDKYSLAYAIGNSIQENKDKIEKLEKRNQKLKEKLNKSNKIIDEILNECFYIYDCPISRLEDENGKIFKLCDCENCEENYKKCWLKYFETEAKAINK